MNRIFIDMDGVIVDFNLYMLSTGLSGDEIKKTPGSYLNMAPIDGAISSIYSLIGMGFEVWVATKPPTGISFAYADKAEWVFRYLPELKRKIIITHDKGLLGDEGDFLCDDRPHKANCDKFKGKLLPFINGYHWPQALDFFRNVKSSLSIPKTCLTDGSPVTPDHRDVDHATGLQKGYVVLCPEERAKGFVRPLRFSYRHVGVKPKYPIRELTAEEKDRYKQYGYVAFEKYPESEYPSNGCYWTQERLDHQNGCGTVTKMSLALAETYARDFSFYSATYCAGCGKHFPVGENGEFVWEGTNEKVGT